MAHKKKSTSTVSKTILSLVVLIPTLFSLVRKTVALIGFEARLAGRSVVIISVLSLFVVILLSSTWLGMLAMLFFYLTSLQWSLQQSMLLIIAANILMLVIVWLVIVKVKKNLSFPETRRQLRGVKRLREDC